MSDKFEEWWNEWRQSIESDAIPDYYNKRYESSCSQAWHASRKQAVKEVIEILKRRYGIIKEDESKSEYVAGMLNANIGLQFEISKKFEDKAFNEYDYTQ